MSSASNQQYVLLIVFDVSELAAMIACCGQRAQPGSWRAQSQSLCDLRRAHALHELNRPAPSCHGEVSEVTVFFGGAVVVVSRQPGNFRWTESDLRP